VKYIQNEEPQPGPSRGRPRKKFAKLSKRSKRRRLARLSQVDDTAINTIINISNKSDRSLTPSNADEVLSLFIEAKLTKHQYLLIRTFVNKKTSSNILPSYQNIINAKKKCYPEMISISESKAEVELQSLLDHTASRIVASQKTVLDSVPVGLVNNLILIGTYGFDGSTGQIQF